jgi:hypothetical protein
MEVAIPQTTTTSTEAARVVPRHDLTTVAGQQPTIITNMVVVRVLQQRVLTMAVVTPQTTTISMEVAQEAQRPVLTMVAARPRTIMTSMEVASVRQQHALTMVVAIPQPITTLTEIAWGQVTVQAMIGKERLSVGKTYKMVAKINIKVYATIIDIVIIFKIVKTYTSF